MENFEWLLRNEVLKKVNVDGENKGFNAALSETGWADGSPGYFPSMERSKINLLHLPYFGRIKKVRRLR